MRRALVGAALGALLLAGCRSTPERGSPAAAERALGAFRQASPLAARQLDAALAWAVFPDLADAAGACEHEGLLYVRGEATPRGASLRCAARPESPAGVAWHELVLLFDARELAALEAGPLELAEALHLDLSAEELPRPAGVIVFTTPRGGLLFEPPPLEQTIELQR